MPSLPSGRRVIAPREVDEVTRTRSFPPVALSPVRVADHLGDLPARRGQALLLRPGPRFGDVVRKVSRESRNCPETVMGSAPLVAI